MDKSNQNELLIEVCETAKEFAADTQVLIYAAHKELNSTCKYLQEVYGVSESTTNALRRLIAHANEHAIDAIDHFKKELEVFERGDDEIQHP